MGAFPWLPILTLSVCSFATCINQTVLYPIIPFFVVDTGMVTDPRLPGDYAGYLTSSGQIGRLLCSMAWGKWSDTHGRKPVLQISLAATAVTSLLFGLTLNFWFVVFLRFVCGAMDFCFGIVKIYVAEGIEEEHRARAMSWTGATWGIAVICGPALGGVLARPAEQYPGVFGGTIFAELPYLLPSLVVTGISVLALLLSHVAMEETVPGARGLRCCCCAKAETSAGPAGRDGATSTSATRGQKRRFFCDRKPGLAMLFYSLLILSEFADEITFPLFAAAPATAGGLGFEAGGIGQVMGVTGVLIIVSQVLVFPALGRAFGMLQILRVGMLCSAVLTPVLPFATHPVVQEPGAEYSETHSPAQLWTCIALGRVVKIVVIEFVFTANSLVGNNAVTSSDRGAYIGVSVPLRPAVSLSLGG